MTKLISWIVTLVVIAAAIAFTIENRDPLTLGFWPLPERYEAPAFAVVLVAAAIGFFVGGAVSWKNAGKWRRRTRDAIDANERVHRDLQLARAEVKKLKEQQFASAPAGLPAAPADQGSRALARAS